MKLINKQRLVLLALEGKTSFAREEFLWILEPKFKKLFLKYSTDPLSINGGGPHFCTFVWHLTPEGQKWWYEKEQMTTEIIRQVIPDYGK